MKLNPSERISAEEALQHPYFEDFHCEIDEIVCENKLNISLDDDDK